MYIIKVRFNEDEQCPEYYAIDSALFNEPKWTLARIEYETLDVRMKYSTFGMADARTIAAQVLCSVPKWIRYAYTDGFMPGATFVFEYDR